MEGVVVGLERGGTGGGGRDRKREFEGRICCELKLGVGALIWIWNAFGS